MILSCLVFVCLFVFVVVVLAVSFQQVFCRVQDMFTFDHEFYLFVCFFPFLLMLKYGIVYISIYLMESYLPS